MVIEAPARQLSEVEIMGIYRGISEKVPVAQAASCDNLLIDMDPLGKTWLTLYKELQGLREETKTNPSLAKVVDGFSTATFVFIGLWIGEKYNEASGLKFINEIYSAGVITQASMDLAITVFFSAYSEVVNDCVSSNNGFYDRRLVVGTLSEVIKNTGRYHGAKEQWTESEVAGYELGVSLAFEKWRYLSTQA